MMAWFNRCQSHSQIMSFDSKSAFDSTPRLWGQASRKRGAVLFEVVVALALFAGAAVVISSALNASLNSVERLRLNTHAANLAVSVLSELQLGIKTEAITGPQPFEPPFERWTWEVIADPQESGATEAVPLRKIEVVIRHDEPEVTYRLSQMLPMESTSIMDADEPGSGSDSGFYSDLPSR